VNLKELWERLRSYLSHAPTCSHWNIETEETCNCGLRTIREELSEVFIIAADSQAAKNIGPQRGPASVAQIIWAQTKQVKKELER
jgi:hypothetical protein